jgi:hypothetical protein
MVVAAIGSLIIPRSNTCRTSAAAPAPNASKAAGDFADRAIYDAAGWRGIACLWITLRKCL